MASADVAFPPVLRKFENINIVQSLVKSAKTNALPERYYFPASVVGSIGTKSSVDLPVIDLAGLAGGDPAAKEEIVKQVGNAASEFGFFQIVNHGFPEDTITALYDQAVAFFELPVDVKDRGEDPTDISHGYEGRMSHKAARAPWLEYLAQLYRPSPAVEALADKVWPSGNPTFCNNVHEYCKSAERLGQQLLELLAESLDLPPEFFSKHFQDPEVYRSSWRLHRYPACPDPSHALGAAPHSDTTILTILRQDAVGGLQIRDRKGDKFIDVTPLPGAFIINIGDTLEAWSNGRFRSVEHKVLVNEKSDRISLVYLFYGASDLEIKSPPELVDEAHPSLYVPFTVGEHRANFEKQLRCNAVVRQASLAFALRPTEGPVHL